MRERIAGRVGRNVTLSVSGQALSYGLSVVSGVIVARWLGPGGKGFLSLLTSAGYICAMTLGLGATTGLTTLMARGLLGPWAAAKTCLGFVLTSTLVSLGLVAMFPNVLGVAAGLAVWLPAAVAVSSLNQFQAAAATGSGRLGSYFVAVVTSSVIQALAYFGESLVLRSSPRAAISAWVVAQGLGGLAGWAHLLRGQPFLLLSLRPHLLTGLRLSLAAFPGLLVSVANAQLDVVILGHWSSAAEVGRYSIAALGVSALAVVPAAIGNALISAYSSQAAPWESARRGMRLALVAGTLSAAVASGAAYYLVPLLLGNEYRAVVPMFWVIMPGFVLFSTCHVSSGFVNVVCNQPWWNGRVATLALLVDMALLAILARPLGGLGAAVASSVAYGLAAVFNRYQLRLALRGKLPLSATPQASPTSAVLQENE